MKDFCFHNPLNFDLLPASDRIYIPFHSLLECCSLYPMTAVCGEIVYDGIRFPNCAPREILCSQLDNHKNIWLQIPSICVMPDYQIYLSLNLRHFSNCHQLKNISVFSDLQIENNIFNNFKTKLMRKRVSFICF